MQVQITIDDANRFGVTYARELRNASLPEEARIATDEAYLTWVLAQAVHNWCEQAQAANAAPPPQVGPVDASGDVLTVTRRQAIQALINRGKYIDAQNNDVQTAINALPTGSMKNTLQNEWTNSQTFDRDRPTVIAMVGAIGIEDRTEWWNYAATL